MNFRASNGGSGHIVPPLPLRWVPSRAPRRMPMLGALAALPLLLLSALPAAAQAPVSSGTLGEALPGGEFEDYLRVMQVAGKSRAYPWSVRGFSPRAKVQS